jgi:hypothetical protein
MRGSRVSAVALSALAVVTLGASCSSSSAADKGQVTKGDLRAFAAGAGQPIGGRAEMVRRKNNTTFVSLRATGLHPGARYTSHVHKQRCQDGDADGHFQQNGPAAGVTPPNEIWLNGGPFAADGAGKANVSTTAGYRANADAVSVVVHDAALPATANKVACANLA